MDFLKTVVIGSGLLLSMTGFLPTSVQAADRGTGDTCAFELVQFTTNFDTGRLDGCEQTGPHSFRLHLRPENTPINPSPWYAFRVEPTVAMSADQELELTLVSHHGPARYAPKVSYDKEIWARLPFEKDGSEMHFSLKVKAERSLYIAGQEIIDGNDYVDWLKELLLSNQLALNEPSATEELTAENLEQLEQYSVRRLVRFGSSREGRPLLGYEHYSGKGKPWLVLIGRQHPPEVTGAMALMHFSNVVLMSDSPELRAMRAQFNLLIAPNMNPDGVARGNWRHTSSGVDLNRNWYSRTEPEAQQLHNFLRARVESDEEIYLVLDFHSTHSDTFYIMPADYESPDNGPLQRPDFVNRWLTSLGEHTSSDLAYKTSARPKGGVMKQYAADKFGVHGVTYEVGDDTPRDEIASKAEAAALSLARQLVAGRQ